MKQWQTPNDCLRAFPPYAKGRPVIIHFCLLSAPPSGASAINSNISFISSSSFSSSSSYWLIPLLLKLDSENHFLTDFLYAIFFRKRIFLKKNSLYPSLSLSLFFFCIHPTSEINRTVPNKSCFRNRLNCPRVEESFLTVKIEGIHFRFPLIIGEI